MGLRRCPTVLLLALVTLHCGGPAPSAALREKGVASPTTPIPGSSTPETRSPQPLGTVPEELAPLYDECGRGDAALAGAASALARAQAAAPGAPPGLDAVSRELRDHGSPYVWPRLWSLDGTLEPAQEVPRLRERLVTLPRTGARRCGVGFARRDDGTGALVVLTVDVQADLDPLPRVARSGQWHRLTAHLTVPATSPKVTLLGPSGAPKEVPASLQGSVLRSTFALDRPGLWTVQVSASTDAGPRPVAEAVVNVDPDGSGAETDTVPGIEEAKRNDAASLTRVLAALREKEGLPQLRRDARLDALAATHLAAMQRHGSVGHDVGDGSPAERVQAAGLNADAVGENVARAPSLAEAHANLWRSPSHRGALLSPLFTQVGLAVAEDESGSVWVVELFARLR